MCQVCVRSEVAADYLQVSQIWGGRPCYGALDHPYRDSQTKYLTSPPPPVIVHTVCLNFVNFVSCRLSFCVCGGGGARWKLH
jgi:hypothetical protein